MAFVLKTYAKPGDSIDPNKSNVPVAPGAVTSPQAPGQVPDRSSITSQGLLPVPPAVSESFRPLSELGTSQAIMGVYEPRDGNENDMSRFEQANATYEEVRKAQPHLRTPSRPVNGYALTAGTRVVVSPELAALTSSVDVAIDPGE